MVNKKSGVIVAAMLCLCCVLSVIYISSCTKTANNPSCDNVVCQNGGYCTIIDTSIYDKTTGKLSKYYPVREQCNCPAGTEGPLCATISESKYIGTWNVKQTVIGSDTAKQVGKVVYYPAYLLKSATPTTFFINNLCDSNNYNDIVCTIDSTNSSNFIIDTLTDFHMFYQHFKLTQQGIGSISGDGSTITATIWTRHLNYNVNWQNDTLQLVMTQSK